MATVDDAVRELRRDPSSTSLFFDFDGTLAPIVEDPDAAAALPGTGPMLEGLVGTYRNVVVVSGRPRSFLATHLPPAVDLVGLYGLEQRVAGHESEHPQAGAWREAIADVRAAAQQGPAGMAVEDKGLSLTLHFRNRPEVEHDVRAWADLQAGRSGLVVRTAKKSIELHPPISTDKGTIIETLGSGAKVVLYAGDDVGDLPGFDGLDRLAAAGATCIGVAVGGAELPASVAERANLVLDGPAAFLDLLRALY